MKKRYFTGLIVIFILIIGSMLLINYKEKNSLIGVYLDNIESTSFPEKNSNYVGDKVICDNDALASWDNNNWSLFINNVSKRSNCKIYFRSKKDITITYDNNYVKDNIFEEVYNTNIFYACCVPDSSKQYISLEKRIQNGDRIYYAERLPKSSDFADCGYYFVANSSNIALGKKYYFQFFAKGNDIFSATIGSELNGTNIFQINNNWQKYSHEFTARENAYGAFIFYNWLSSTDNRTLQIKNMEMQEGEYDNFSTINLKEYDTLSSTLPTPTRDNYTFLGWYTNPIEGEKISSETQVTEDTTFYAHWQYNS